MREIHITRVIESTHVPLKTGQILGFFRWRDAPKTVMPIVFMHEIEYEDVLHNSSIRGIPDIVSRSSDLIGPDKYHLRIVKRGLVERLNELRTQYLDDSTMTEFCVVDLKWGEQPDFEYEVISVNIENGHVMNSKRKFINRWFSFFLDADALTPEDRIVFDELVKDGSEVFTVPSAVIDGDIVSVKCPESVEKILYRDGVESHLIIELHLRKIIIDHNK